MEDGVGGMEVQHVLTPQEVELAHLRRVEQCVRQFVWATQDWMGMGLYEAIMEAKRLGLAEEAR